MAPLVEQSSHSLSFFVLSLSLSLSLSLYLSLSVSLALSLSLPLSISLTLSLSVSLSLFLYRQSARHAYDNSVSSTFACMETQHSKLSAPDTRHIHANARVNSFRTSVLNDISYMTHYRSYTT